MTAKDDPDVLSPGMPPGRGYEVQAEFDHFVLRGDLVADLAETQATASVSSNPR